MVAEEGEEEGNEVEQGIATQHPGTSPSALQLMIPPTTTRPSNDPRLPTSKRPTCTPQVGLSWPGPWKAGWGQIFPMGRRLVDLEKEEASAVARWEGAGNPTINVIKSWQDKLCHTRHTGVCG